MLQEGKVKWFDNRKGIGFISPNDGEKDIFVHYSHINGEPGERVTLQDNQSVTFEVTKTEKGLMAINVTGL